MLEKAKPIAKALASVLTSFVLTGGAFASDGNLSWTEILISLITALGAGGIVYRVPNHEPSGRHEQNR